MSGLSDIDGLAAEYVLGTLDAAERASVAVRRSREPALDAAISAWEQKLAPLDALAEPVAPPPDLLRKIEQRLDTQSRVTPVVSAETLDLRRRLKRWRASALVASAAAASLLIGISVREWTRAASPQNLVAVFQKDDASPAFVMTVDVATRRLSIRRISADVPAGKTYQLWIASDKLGPGPQSLGLIEDTNGALQKTLDALDPAVVQSAQFGVSLEPVGGSPTGKPTGPAYHSYLLKTSQ